MELLRYQNQPNDSHKFDDLIFKFQEWKKDPDPETTHIELGFSDGSMFSSSGRGGFFAGHGFLPGVGTRFEDSSIIDPGKWRIDRINCTQVEEVAIMRWCKKQLYKAYDWIGIVGQPLPGNIQLGWMWYCSEVTHRACWKYLREVDLPEMKKIRPGQVAEIYKKAGLIQ
jgi:hypothetical protein